MNILLRLAGAATLAAALMLTGCAKKTDQSTTSGTTTTTTATDATPAAEAAAATPVAEISPSAAATGRAVTVTVSTGAPAAGGAKGFIELPVYPGATQSTTEGMSVAANGTALSIKVFSTSDDPKKVSDWYKSHLPSSWKGGVISAGDQTVGTFANEMADGDQSVIIANQAKTTRIQLTTKHGK